MDEMSKHFFAGPALAGDENVCRTGRNFSGFIQRRAETRTAAEKAIFIFVLNH
jgi:hypothetical protein